MRVHSIEGLTNVTRESRPLRLEIQELETFVTVAKCGGFRAAAVKLNITQPSVTNRIHRLEALLRTKLLVRTTRHVELSPAGRELFERAELALYELRNFAHDLIVQSDADHRKISLATTPTLGALVVPTLLQEIRKGGFCFDLEILDGTSEEVHAALDSGAADVALLSDICMRPEESSEIIGESQILLFAAQGHGIFESPELYLEDVMRFPLILFDAGHDNGGDIRKKIVARHQSPTVAHTCRNISTLMGLVAAGEGIAFLPAYIGAMNRSYSVDARSVQNFQVSRRYGLVQKPSRGKEHPMTVLRKILTQYFTPNDLTAIKSS